MRRLFSFVVAAAAALAFSAAPATADQGLKFGPGPPILSGDIGGKGALVVHCNPINPTFPGERPGAVVFTPNVDERGNDCFPEG